MLKAKKKNNLSLSLSLKQGNGHPPHFLEIPVFPMFCVWIPYVSGLSHIKPMFLFLGQLLILYPCVYIEVCPRPLTVQNCPPFINHIPKKHNHIGGNSGHFRGSLGSASLLRGKCDLGGPALFYPWRSHQCQHSHFCCPPPEQGLGIRTLSPVYYVMAVVSAPIVAHWHSNMWTIPLYYARAVSAPIVVHWHLTQ